MGIGKGRRVHFVDAAADAVEALRGFQRGLQAFGRNLNSNATQDERSAFIAFVLTWWNEEGQGIIERAEER